jgi:hypothetical protein
MTLQKLIKQLQAIQSEVGGEVEVVYLDNRFDLSPILYVDYRPIARKVILRPNIPAKL